MNDTLLFYPHDYDIARMNIAHSSNSKKIIVLSEPIKNCSNVNDKYKRIYHDMMDNKFDIIFGCINHDPSNNKFKFPIYLLEKSFPILSDYNNLLVGINNDVKNMNLVQLKRKMFCTLINNWDPVNVRTLIYNKLKNIQTINCPSTLFNNCSNHELNNIGNAKYINKFLFNICAENFDNNNIDGYITEKLMNACLGGAIPIYAGWFDALDEKIFNKNRILFYKSTDNTSIENVYNKVNFLANNPEKLVEFYKQPVFCDTAYETIEFFKKEFLNKLNIIKI